MNYKYMLQHINEQKLLGNQIKIYSINIINILEYLVKILYNHERLEIFRDNEYRRYMSKNKINGFDDNAKYIIFNQTEIDIRLENIIVFLTPNHLYYYCNKMEELSILIDLFMSCIIFQYKTIKYILSNNPFDGYLYIDEMQEFDVKKLNAKF